jgi:hypothetical protein
MKGEPENIDHLFAEELKGFSPTPPEGAWKSIEQRMAAQQTRKNTIVLLPHCSWSGSFN